MASLQFNDLLVSMPDRVLILDGAMGTVARQLVPDLTGCSDTLSITHPDIVTRIHRSYIDAGADIITTNTLCANDVSMPDHDIVTLNRAATALALDAATQTSRKIWVAGSLCPVTGGAAYTRQIETLIEAGIDTLLIETVYNTHNARAAICCAAEAMSRLRREVPIMLSATLSPEGLLPSGENIDNLITLASGCPNLVTLGLNCGYGPTILGQYLPILAKTGLNLSFHPNAGLPGNLSQYELAPDDFARQTLQAAAHTHTRIIGGCCGTTPDHIAALARYVRSFPKTHNYPQV